jgi:hypothetical protein
MKNRVYTAAFQNLVLPGAAMNVTFQINNFNRTAKLKSLFFDLRIRENVTNLPLQLENNNTQLFQLVINAFASPFAQIFEAVAGAVIFANGVQFIMRRPNQLKFDSFYIPDTLGFAFNYQNFDLLLSFVYEVTVVCEIEDISVI